MKTTIFTLVWSLGWAGAALLLWRCWSGRGKIYGLFLLSMGWLEGIFILLPRLMGWKW